MADVNNPKHGDSALFENRTLDETRLLTVPELAARLQVGDKKVYRLVEAKEIPGIPVGGSWRFHWGDVLSALRARSKLHGDSVS